MQQICYDNQLWSFLPLIIPYILRERQGGEGGKDPSQYLAPYIHMYFMCMRVRVSVCVGVCMCVYLYV